MERKEGKVCKKCNCKLECIEIYWCKDFLSGSSLVEIVVKQTCGEKLHLVVVDPTFYPIRKWTGGAYQDGFTKIIPLAVTGSSPSTKGTKGERAIANGKARGGMV